MNRLEKWLLRKLIDKAIQKRMTHIVMQNIWAAAKYRFYEDNVPTRYAFLKSFLRCEMQDELDELEEVYGNHPLQSTVHSAER